MNIPSEATSCTAAVMGAHELTCMCSCVRVCVCVRVRVQRLAEQFASLTMGGPNPGQENVDLNALPRPVGDHKDNAFDAPQPYDAYNCSPDNMRMTVNAMPNGTALRARYGRAPCTARKALYVCYSHAARCPCTPVSRFLCQGSKDLTRRQPPVALCSCALCVWCVCVCVCVRERACVFVRGSTERGLKTVCVCVCVCVRRWPLPFGALVHPMADERLGRTVPVVPLAGYGIIRCKRCRTYMNPFMTWTEGGRRYVL